MSQGSTLSRRSSVAFILVLLLIFLSFGLRLVYVTRISLYIDEFTSVWAGKLILQRGLPLTPAGVIYHRGILFSYVVAFSQLLFGVGAEASRMASVFIACVTVPCLYLAGKRMFSDRNGLLAAAFLSFAPQAVVWGGRVRMYALLQLLSLLAVFFLYVAVVRSRRAPYQYLFVICFCAAIFAQEQAILLYPAMLVAVVALGRWRWFLERGGLLANAVCCLAIFGRYLLDQVGRPTQFELVQDAGQSSGLIGNLVSGFRAYVSFFLHPHQLLLTVLCTVALVYGLWAVRRGGKRLAPGGDSWLQSLAFCYLVLLVTVLEMLVAGGERWSDARYFFMVLPLLMLGAAAGLDRTVALMEGWTRTARASGLSGETAESVSWPIALSLVGLVAIAYVPGVNGVLSRQIEGHDRAMEYVKDRWREGDVILMASPPVCAVYLGHCDYYAIQKGYEGYIVDVHGESVDVWTGSPLLDSVDQLRDVLREHDRVWLVVDGWRLATRYELDFLQLIAEQMDLLREVQGVKILLSNAYAPLPRPAVRRSLAVNLENKVTLVGYDLQREFVEPEERVCLTLYWRASARLTEEYTVFVHLVSREGSLVGQDDAAPMSGLYPTTYWQEDQTIPDRHCFVAHGDLAADRYLLEVGMYHPQSAERLEVVDTAGRPVANRVVLDYVRVESRQESIPEGAHEVRTDFGGQLLLQGYDLGTGLSASDRPVLTARPGAEIPTTLYWKALASMDTDFTVFLHIVDQEGHIWGQADGQPDRGFYPTSFWDVGETVADQHAIPLDTLTPEGDYELVAGAYNAATGERLPVMGTPGRISDDKVFLGVIRVEKN